MIVRNEEASLAACLASAVDLVDEVVVVDTGSADRTQEIARGHGAKVYDYAWRDDFAAARNESLRHAGGDWIFWLDGDEWLDDENRAKLQSLFAGLGPQMMAYSMCQLCLRPASLPGAAGGFDQRVEQVRLFPNHPEVRWSYRVFEQIFPAVQRQGGHVHKADVVIHHSGYQDAGQHLRKIERNLRLAELDLRDHPDDAYVPYTLGVFHQMLGQHAESVPRLRAARERLAPQASYGAKLHALLVQAHQRLAQAEAAWEVNLAGRCLYPEDDELRFQEAELREQAGDLAGAEAAWRDLEARLAATPAWEGERRHMLDMARQNLANLQQQQGRTAAAPQSNFDEARREHQGGNSEKAVSLYRQYLLDEPNHAQAWYLLGAALTQLGRLDEARSSLLQATSIDPRHAEARNHLGLVLAQQGSLDEAIASFRRALEMKPDNSEILNNLGLALLQQGQANDAIAAFRRALVLRPDDVKARHNLDRALGEAPNAG
ncbi:MAG TPA: tetratricopeptide repeat protein [Pirellulales bacterium]|nr:tetratricopeptide repeat protein [Pirellulales bacterium]